MGKSLREVSEEIGVSFSYVSDIERGRRDLPEHRVGDFARALGFDADELAIAHGHIAPDIREALRDPAFVRLVRGLMGAR